jgi:hypothetical protein
MKEMTLNGLGTMMDELGAMMEHVVKHMATKDDITELRAEFKSDMSGLATKVQLFDLQNQVHSIESQIRHMNHGKLEVRVADLEEEVFGKVRD